MRPKSTAGQSAGPTDPAGLVLEPLPNGEYAWLRPALDAALRDSDQVDAMLTRLLDRRPEPQPEPDERRVALTQRGRDLLARWRAEQALFGREVTAA